MTDKLINFFAPEDLRERLKTMAKANDRTVSHEMRRILREALEEFEAQESHQDKDSVWKYRLVPNQPRYKSQGD